MHYTTEAMMVANYDYEDNKGSSDADYFWGVFVAARKAWRDARKPN